MNFIQLSTFVSNEEETVDWCKKVGLLPAQMDCPKCQQPMTLIKDKGLGHFRCQKNKKHRNKKTVSISVATDTWFQEVRLPINKVILLMYCFIRRLTYADTIHEVRLADDDTELSPKTIADWFSFCREICMFSLDREYDELGPLEGIVEIDETKIGKRKYNRGRIVEGSWIFGLISRDGGGFRLEICPDNKRDSETLLALIQKHVKPGSTIISDGWKAYECLKDHGYKHMTVVHEQNFVDPETGAHTQEIESNWRALKRRLCRGGIPVEGIAHHLCEYLWRWEAKNKGLDLFAAFIESVKKTYSIYQNGN